jgi:uncharacterized protein DUF4150
MAEPFPVTNEDLTVVSRGTRHIAVSTAPDLCFVNPPNYLGFPNHVRSRMLAKGATTTVLMGGEPIWTKIGELGPPSDPRHAGKKGGIYTKKYRYEAVPKKWSPDLFAEKQPVVRATDTTWQNHKNTDGVVIHSSWYVGLFDPTAMMEFCAAWRKLRADWKSLDAVQRLHRMEDAINARLKAAGVPPISLTAGPKSSPSTNGNFDWRNWGIDINQDRLGNDITDAQFNRLGQTVYHEGRHAEQLWNSARSQAGAGLTAAQISADHGYPLNIAQQAAASPISGTGPRASQGTAVTDSLWGSGRAGRIETLTQLPIWSNRVSDLMGQLQRAGGNPQSYAGIEAAIANREQIMRIQGELNTAQAERDKYYQRYRKLPEEKDAWDVGTAFAGSC